MTTSSSRMTHSAGIFIIVVLIPVATYLPLARHEPLYAWVAVLVLMTAFATVTGHAIVGCWRGILIDERNVISLSRFQMALWTLIVLSAFFSAALFNVYTGVGDPLSIAVPTHLWTLLGISTTSLVGSPLILSQKTTDVPSQPALDNTLNQLAAKGLQPTDTKTMGTVIGNTRPQIARWSDMLTGDETSNGAYVDLAKLQMFFFTLLIAFAYCATLWNMFANAQSDGISALPALDKSTVALMGVSHAGYLLNKAVPRNGRATSDDPASTGQLLQTGKVQ